MIENSLKPHWGKPREFVDNSETVMNPYEAPKSDPPQPEYIPVSLATTLIVLLQVFGLGVAVGMLIRLIRN